MKLFVFQCVNKVDIKLIRETTIN